MRLYYPPGACSLSARIVAREAGTPIELSKVRVPSKRSSTKSLKNSCLKTQTTHERDLKSHQIADGQDYFGINPHGYVPALQFEDGSVLCEGPAIVQLLADRAPESGLRRRRGQ
jgi:glutathione S-transferase